MKEIEAIRAVIKDATPGPWKHLPGDYSSEDVITGKTGYVIEGLIYNLNAPYIAACNPAAMKAVLAHIDAQAAEIERLNDKLARRTACKGIPRVGCDYLAPCDMPCNKCGEIHHHHQMVARFDAQPSVPAWHDAPTVPGLWVCQLNGQAYRWPNQYINASVSRWFGPIPEETK